MAKRGLFVYVLLVWYVRATSIYWTPIQATKTYRYCCIPLYYLATGGRRSVSTRRLICGAFHCGPNCTIFCFASPIYVLYPQSSICLSLSSHSLFSLSLSFFLFSFLSLYFSCAFSIFLRLGADYSICDSKWHTTTLSFIFFLPFYTKKSKALNDHEHAVLPCGIGEKFKRPSISFAFFALRLFSHLYNTAPSLFVRFLENFSVPLFACGLKRNFIYTRHAEALGHLIDKTKPYRHWRPEMLDGLYNSPTCLRNAPL